MDPTQEYREDPYVGMLVIEKPTLRRMLSQRERGKTPKLCKHWIQQVVYTSTNTVLVKRINDGNLNLNDYAAHHMMGLEKFKQTYRRFPSEFGW